jgi:hypothetical protein
LSKLEFATLISLVPIVTLSVAFLNDRVIFPRSEVTLSLLRCRLNSIDIAAVNQGARPGIVSSGRVKQIIQDGETSKTFLLLADPGATTLNSGLSAIVSMSIRANDPDLTKSTLQPAPIGKRCHYAVSIDVVEFGSTHPEPKTMECACPGSSIE